MLVLFTEPVSCSGTTYLADAGTIWLQSNVTAIGWATLTAADNHVRGAVIFETAVQLPAWQRNCSCLARHALKPMQPAFSQTLLPQATVASATTPYCARVTAKGTKAPCSSHSFADMSNKDANNQMYDTARQYD